LSFFIGVTFLEFSETGGTTWKSASNLLTGSLESTQVLSSARAAYVIVFLAFFGFREIIGTTTRSRLSKLVGHIAQTCERLRVVVGKSPEGLATTYDVEIF